MSDTATPSRSNASGSPTSAHGGSADYSDGQKSTELYLSSERTFLSWLRTILSVMALGFIVSRFGWSQAAEQGLSKLDFAAICSTLVGTLLVLWGVVGTAVAYWQFARFRKSLPEHTLPPGHNIGMIFTFAVMLIVLGLILAGFLLAGPFLVGNSAAGQGQSQAPGNQQAPGQSSPDQPGQTQPAQGGPRDPR